MARPPTPLTDRLLAKVDTTSSPNGCWLWTGSTRQGYGQIRTRNSEGEWSTSGAHRVAYELIVGPVPDGLDLDHLCRVILCVNPVHLEPVTRRVNVLRGVGFAALNARKVACSRGHLFGEDRYSTGSRRCVTCDPLPEPEQECTGCATVFAIDVHASGRRRRYCTDACRIAYWNRVRAA